MSWLSFSQEKRGPDRNKQIVNMLTMGICLLNHEILQDTCLIIITGDYSEVQMQYSKFDVPFSL